MVELHNYYTHITYIFSDTAYNFLLFWKNLQYIEIKP